MTLGTTRGLLHGVACTIPRNPYPVRVQYIHAVPNHPHGETRGTATFPFDWPRVEKQAGQKLKINTKRALRHPTSMIVILTTRLRFSSLRIMDAHRNSLSSPSRRAHSMYSTVVGVARGGCSATCADRC